MTTESQKHRIFKSFLRSIAADDLSLEDYRGALSDLRDPRMVGLLEELLAALSGDLETSPAPSKVATRGNREREREVKKEKKGRATRTADQLFDDIKRRKVTRDRLTSILSSVDSEFASEADSYDTMRSLVASYRRRATDRQWEILTAIVNGDYERDPYLNDMS